VVAPKPDIPIFQHVAKTKTTFQRQFQYFVGRAIDNVAESLVSFILSPREHDNGYMDGQSQI